MESSQKTAQHPEDLTSGLTLQVDFSWKKFKALITEKDDLQQKPIYVVDFKTFKPNLVFKTAADGNTFATGSLHALSINADCEIHGKPVTITALKRFKTEYMHLSYAFSSTNTPVPMTWTSTSDFKSWDFICLDSQQIPVAKFSANIWGLRKLGSIEFLESNAPNNAATRDEIVVTGLTLYYCMLLRTSSILSLFGAVLHRPDQNVKNMMRATPTQLAIDNKKASGDAI